MDVKHVHARSEAQSGRISQLLLLFVSFAAAEEREMHRRCLFAEN